MVYLVLDRNWSLYNGVHSQDGGLRQVDDGHRQQGTEHAAIADGESAALHVTRTQFTCSTESKIYSTEEKIYSTTNLSVR